MRKQLQRLLAIILCCMSAAILLAEATILPSGVDLSLFSILINAVGKQEVFVQIAVLIPLMYMCICTYYSLFKIGMLMFYSLTPRQTSSVSLLMICSMVARYAPPISYNFLNLIRLDGGTKTIFEKRMGNIDDAVPFFGNGFNKIYPLIMVIYTLLLASNFFDRVIEYFGNWKIFNFKNEAADATDGFDQSGMIILQRERSWLEQGHKVGELIIPLARNFNNASVDVEAGNSNNIMDKSGTEMKVTTKLVDGSKSNHKALSEESQNANAREAISKKFAAIREQHSRQASYLNSSEKNPSPSTTSSSDSNSTANRIAGPSGLASTWASMKTGFQKVRSNIEAKKFLPLRQMQETDLISRNSSSESLDEIFQRLKKPTVENRNHSDDEE